MIPGIILSWLGGNWRWLAPSIACLGLVCALWWANNTHALERAKSATEIAKLERSVSECKAASSQALADAQASARKKEQEYAKQATDSERSYDELSRMYAEKVRAYIHRGTTSATAKSDSARLPETAPAQTELASGGVIISLEDMQICTENTAKVQAASEWAVGL